MLSKELKENVLDEEKLKAATKQVKEQVEEDIEGSFEAEQFEKMKQDRRSIMIGAISAAKTHIGEAEDLKDDIDERENEEDFQDDRRRDTINNEDYNELKKLMRKYRFLYTHFTAMFYAENQFSDHLVEAVDLQKDMKLKQQNIKALKQIPETVKDAVDYQDEIHELEKKISRQEEDNQDLQERLLKMKEKISEIEENLEDESNEEETEEKKPEISMDKFAKSHYSDLTAVQRQVVDNLNDNPDIDDLESLADSIDSKANRTRVRVHEIVDKAEVLPRKIKKLADNDKLRKEGFDVP